MSDMALVAWQRKAARQIRPVFWRPAIATGAIRPAIRFVSIYPALLGGVLAAAMACVFIAASKPAVPATSIPVLGVLSTQAWLDIVRPLEIFSLEADDLAKGTKVYKARRSPSGGGRQDTLAFGALAGKEPALRLFLYRRGAEASPSAPVFADIARLAAEAGLSVSRSGLPDLMTTRFGKFQVAEVLLSSGATPASPCSGFRLVMDAPALTVTGLACGGGQAAMTRERLGCLLERLDLVSGGGDKPLVDYFAATELKRNAACAGMRLGPNTVHAAWLDDRAATPRKNIRHR